MDLIIKPFERCNFKCTFCSSTSIQAKNDKDLDLDYVRRFLDRFPNTNTIIINGGDPLMIDPSYYWEVLGLLKEREMFDTTLSFTSNLWIFYKQPDKWEELFNHRQVGVATSFQYGNARLKGDFTPYTESDFWKVSDLFLERVGYRPEFISVITHENEDTVIKTVELAREMDVVCKVNIALASGPKKLISKGIVMGSSGYTYLIGDIYRHYLEIYDRDLHPWEFNTQQMLVRLKGSNTICPQNRSCDEGIRTLQPGGKYYSCGAFGDDGLYSIDFDKEMKSNKIIPILQQPELISLKDECFTCPMFKICNGCKKTIHDLKTLDLVEKHCSKMKLNAERIIEISR